MKAMKRPLPRRPFLLQFLLLIIAAFLCGFSSSALRSLLPLHAPILDGLLIPLLLLVFLLPCSYLIFLRPLSRSLVERGRSEETHNESEERYRLLHENAGIGIGYCRPDGTVISYNRLAAGHMGGIPEDFYGKNLHEIFPKAEAELYQGRIRRAAVCEDPQVYEDRVVLPTGELFFLSTFARILNSGREVIGIQIISQDITRQKKTEEELKKSALLLDSCIESIKGAFISSIDKDYNYLYFNDAHKKRMKDIYGADIGIGMNLLGCISIEDDKQSTRNRYGRALLGEYVTLTKAYMDEPTTYESSFNPIRDKNGAVIGATAFSFDVTELMKTQEALKKSQRLLESIIDAIRGASISCIDRNFDYLYCNSTHKQWMKSIYGVEVETGKNLFDCITVEEEKSGTRSSFARAFSGESFTIHRSYQNSPSLHENSFTPIRNENNEITGVTAFSLDITDRVTAENEKRRSDDYLQQVQRLESLGILAGGIAHDFNNILTGVFGFTDLAITKVKDPIASEYLSKAMENMERAKGLTQQLLTFAKGGMPIKKTTSIPTLLKETSAFALSGSNVKCSYKIQQGLWHCSVDRNQIGQVIQNLMINAVQAMPMGGIIEISARNLVLEDKGHPTLAKGNHVCVSIKDQGIGIPGDMLQKIFDPFFTTKEKGHGLGLAISYSIIKKHDGAIDVHSELGKGSVFLVYLPACGESYDENAQTSVVRHKGSGRILVMDDEESVGELIAQMLRSFGYSVVRMDNGKDAIAFFEEQAGKADPIRGMILDLTIPGGMGGQDVAAEIRKRDKDIPLFVASGYADDPVMARPQEYGFTGSISKPFNMRDLMELLDRHMGGTGTGKGA